MRILHTADWHLGHTLHGYSREADHRAFLDWLLEQVTLHKVDLLLVAGDIFDSANPPAAAQAAYYSFLAAAHERNPALEMVVIAGNHDSPQRLQAPEPLLKLFNVHVIGSSQQRAIKLKCGAGCAAVPYLRPSDLPNIEADDPLIAGVETIYRETFAELDGLPLIAMGHAYFRGGSLSELSERKILGGNQHALPIDFLPDNLIYGAFGHLHRPQSIGGRDELRYSGSPIPLSLAEGEYPHQVILVEWENEKRKITPLRLPLTTSIERIGPFPLEPLLEKLRTTEFEGNPYVEVIVDIEKPEPHLRYQVEQTLVDKELRLCKITPRYQTTKREPKTEQNLQQLTPDEVFLHRYQMEHEGEPPKPLMECYHNLVEEASR